MKKALTRADFAYVKVFDDCSRTVDFYGPLYHSICVRNVSLKQLWAQILPNAVVTNVHVSQIRQMGFHSHHFNSPFSLLTLWLIPMCTISVSHNLSILQLQ